LEKGLENEKAWRRQFQPSTQRGPRGAAARLIGRPSQRPTEKSRTRPTHLQKRAHTHDFNYAVLHYSISLDFCTKHPRKHRLRNDRVPAAPTRAGVTPASTAWPRQPIETPIYMPVKPAETSGPARGSRNW